MKLIALAIIAATAGLATTNPIISTGLTEYTVDDAGTPTASIVIDISGYNTWDEQGAAVNETLSIFVGIGTEITGIGWNVNITTAGASWASEATLSFEDQINLAPGSIDDFPVTNVNYNSGGIIDLTDAGLSNILLSADGFLDIEFFESFDDEENTIDSTFDAGSTITIIGAYWLPTPSTLAMLGFGSLIATRRKR